MDNFDLINFDENSFKEKEDLKKEPETIPFDDSEASSNGGIAKNESAKPTAEAKTPSIAPGQRPAPLQPRPNPPRPVRPPQRTVIPGKIPQRQIVPERITGVKTFFTKLHVGSIDYIDEQIRDWLKENPNIRIKHTNMVCGMVVSKTTEPNLIVTVWY